ncbi:hypothetical protein [Pseudochryseolinea flava]|nr:hypothetical protein [Pseudochryseolinea flava]
MQDWKEIKDEKDIETLLDLYGHFHDGCLREVHIVTRESITKELSMTFDGHLTATLLFQRQYKNPTVIELRFDNVEKLNFNPPASQFNSIIYDVTFKKVDNLFYWASEDNWEIGDNDAVWISGESVFWRERPELIGQVNRLNDE